MSSPHHFMPLLSLLPLGCPDNAKYSGTALKISGCLKVMPWAMLYLTLKMRVVRCWTMILPLSGSTETNRKPIVNLQSFQSKYIHSSALLISILSMTCNTHGISSSKRQGTIPNTSLTFGIFANSWFHTS